MDRQYSKVFEKIPRIVLKKGKSLKVILVRAKVPPLKTEDGFYGPCNKNKATCEICKHISKTRQFESSSTNDIYSIRPQNLNCVSKNVVYLCTCKTCHKQCTDSTEEFRSRFDNCRCLHRKFFRNKKVKQESFHAHFVEGLHRGESDWEVRIIYHGVSVDDVRRRESYWQHKLDLNELNER